MTVDAEGIVVHRSFIPESDWGRYSNRWDLPGFNNVP